MTLIRCGAHGALLVALTGCWGGDSIPPPTPVAALPVLREVALPPSLDAVGGAAAAVKVGPQGAVLVRAVPGAREALALHLPGAGWRRFAPEGDGPGELRFAMPMAVTDSHAMAWGLGSFATAAWTLDSLSFRGGVRADGAISPAFLVAGRGIVGTVERRDGTVPVLLDPQRGGVRSLLPVLDTAYQRIFPHREGLAVRFGNPAVVGEWPGGFLVGNGFSYQLVAYDWEGRYRFAIGRDLGRNRRSPAQVEREMAALERSVVARSPAEREAARRRLASDSVRWFSHLSPPRPDHAGRIWIVGSVGDTTFADLFAEAHFIGRLVLDCPGFRGRWALERRWLALVCEAPDDRDAEVKLWEVG